MAGEAQGRDLVSMLLVLLVSAVFLSSLLLMLAMAIGLFPSDITARTLTICSPKKNSRRRNT